MFTFKTRMILRAVGAVFGMAAVLTTVSGCGSVPETVVTTPAAVTDTDTVPADATPGPVPTGATTTNGAAAPSGMTCANETNTSQPNGIETICSPIATTPKPKATSVRHTGTMTSHIATPATVADTAPVSAAVIDAPPTGLVNPGATTPDDPTAARVGPIL